MAALTAPYEFSVVAKHKIEHPQREMTIEIEK